MSHGHHWAALFDEVPGDIPELLARLVEDGRYLGECEVMLPDSTGHPRPEKAFALEYPNTPLRYLGLCATRSEGPEVMRDFMSGFPFCAVGCEVPLEILEVHEDPDLPSLEGGLEVSTLSGGLAYVTDPLFFLNRSTYERGSVRQFRVAGLAYELRPPSSNVVTIREGKFLEFHKQLLLERDPQADVDAVSSVDLSLEGMHFLNPASHDPFSSSFRAPVENVTTFRLEGTEIMALRMTLIPDDKGPLTAVIYASAERMGAFRPDVGADVEGEVWLQAHPL